MDRGLHPAFQQLPALLQGTSGKLVGRLQAVLSQLAHWCPLFGEEYGGCGGLLDSLEALHRADRNWSICLDMFGQQ